MKHLLILILLATVASARGAIVANQFTTTSPNSFAPWQWPVTGNLKSQLVDYGTVVNGTTNVTNFFLASGAGIVRKARLVVQGGVNFPDFTNVILHVAYDGQADACNLPWIYFAGILRTNINDLLVIKGSTAFFEVTDLRNAICDIDLKYPIPFTNGCTIWTSSSASPDVTMASRVEYQDAMFTNSFSGVRFHCTNCSMVLTQETLPAGTIAFNASNPTYMIGTGTAFDSSLVGKHLIAQAGYGNTLEIMEPLVTAVTNTTAATVSWGTMPRAPIYVNGSGGAWMVPTAIDFLKRSSGMGVVASVGCVFTNWAVSSNMRWFLNQASTPNYEFWDTEQFFGANNGFDAQPSQDMETGQTYLSDDITVFGGYRHFFYNPLFYTNGIRMNVSHQGDLLENFPSAGTAVPSRVNFLTVYYEQ